MKFITFLLYVIGVGIQIVYPLNMGPVPQETIFGFPANFFITLMGGVVMLVATICMYYSYLKPLSKKYDN